MHYPAGVKRKKESKDGEAHLGFEAVLDKKRQNEGLANQDTSYLSILQLPFNKEQE